MISYKDKTFCPFHTDCSGAKDCGRALTQEVLMDAQEWWQGFKSEDDVPISMYASQPDCWKEKA
jgi:hypothetical protein